MAYKAEIARLTKARERIEARRSIEEAQQSLFGMPFEEFRSRFRPEMTYDSDYAFLKYPLRLLLAGESLDIMKGSQMGVTELFISLCLHWLACGSTNVFYMLPTDADITDFTMSRMDPILLATELSDLLIINNVHLKQIGHSNLYLRAGMTRAGKPTSKIKSVPVSRLIIDEVEEIPEVSLDIVEERLSGSQDKQRCRFSTPFLPDSGISKMLKQDNLYRYYLSCIHCNLEQYMSLEGNLDLEIGTYQCRSCRKPWSQEEKIQMVRAAVETGWKLDEFSGSNIYGFYLPQLYSPTISAIEVCEKYHAADNELKKQNFYNHKLGLPYVAEGARVSPALLNDRIGTYSANAFRVSGIDVSSASPHYVAVAEWTPIGPVVLDIARVPWEGLHHYFAYWDIKSFVIDALPERKMARDLIANCRESSGWCAFYPNQKDLLVPDENRREVKLGRTEMLDILFDRIKNDRILIDRKCSESTEYPHLVAHICNLVRGYRETKTGYEAHYTETGPDHYAHALVYLEAAGRLLAYAPIENDGTLIGKFI